MKTALPLALIILLLLTQASWADSRKPETVVNEFYSWYLKRFNQKNGAVLIRTELPGYKNHLTRDLYTQLYREESLDTKDQLDWCVLVGGNCGWDAFTLGKTSVKGPQAEVIVHVVGNTLIKWNVTVHLKHEGGNWRINDVDLPDKVHLLDALSPQKKSTEQK